MIVKYKSGNNIKTVDLTERFGRFVSSESVVEIGNFCKSDIIKSLSIIRQVDKLIAISGENEIFDESNIKSLIGTYRHMASQTSARVYRSDLRKLLGLLTITKELDIYSITEAAHRKGDGSSKKPSISKKPRRNGLIPADEVMNGYINNDITPINKSRVERTKLTNDDLKLASDVTFLNTGNRVVRWKNTNNKRVEIDFNDNVNFNYSYCNNEVLAQYLYESFENSDWSEPTKYGYIQTIKKILKFNAEYVQSNNPINKEVFIRFLKHREQEALSKGKLKNTTLSQAKRNCNAILSKFGLGRIPKGHGYDYKAGGNELVTNEYSKSEWIAIIRALHGERKEIKIELEKGFSIYWHNKYVLNSLCMVCIYTAATSSELFTAFTAEEHVSFITSGKNWYTVHGIKNRASKINNITLNLKNSGKLFLSEYITYITKFNNTYSSYEPLFFPLLTKTKTVVQVNGELLLQYKNKLTSENNDLAALAESTPSFKFRLQRIRSSSLSRTSRTLSEGTSIAIGNHTLSTHMKYNYSKGDKIVNQVESAKSANTMEAFVRNNGDIKIAIQTASNIMKIPVQNMTEYESHIANSQDTCKTVQGGICKGEENKQTRSFQRSAMKNSLLDKEDVEKISCGFVIECFNCSNFGVINDVEDIWCLLSFRHQLNNSLENHCSLKHFLKNFGDVMLSIDELLDRLTAKKVGQANKRISSGNFHPQWSDTHSVADVLGTQS